MNKQEIQEILKNVSSEHMGLFDLLKILAILEKIPFFKAYTFFNVIIPVFILFYLLSFKYSIQVQIIDKKTLRPIEGSQGERIIQDKKRNPFGNINQYI